MIETLARILAKGPFETKIMTHGTNAAVALRVTVISADQAGIVCKVKGMMGGEGKPRVMPWASIQYLDLPE